MDSADMDIVSDTDEHLSETSDEVSEEDWQQVEQDIQRLSALQTEAYERMMALTHLLSSLEPSKDILSVIQQCHEESFHTLEQTGEVTFGQRLLAAFQER